MKPHNFLIASLVATAAFMGCGADESISPEMKMTPVYVESGTINDRVIFVSNGAFDARNTAIGMIDSTDCAKTTNGYADKSGWIYVFEGGRSPQKALDDTESDRFKCLTEADWQNDYIYNLSLDAQICNIPTSFKVYLREKGDYQRQKAVIYNTNVYRFKNRYVIEDYHNFSTYHESLRPNVASGDFFELLGLSKEQYSATYNGVTFNGSIKYDAFTKRGQTDKIVFVSKTNENVKYRLRHIYVDYDRDTVSTYFDGNVLKKIYQRANNNSSTSKWINYLQINIIPNYLEAVVTGFECTSCTQSKQTRLSLDANMPPPLCGGN